MNEPAMVPRAGIVFDSDLALQPKADRVILPSGDRPAQSASELVITDLADENALLAERVASLEADVHIYRDMLRASLSVNQRLTALLERQRETIRRWLDPRR